MKVFEEEWLKKIALRYDYRDKYTAPFVVKLAFDPILEPERDSIEEWFSRLPDTGKPEILRRLRSTDSREHFGAYFELVLHEHLNNFGFSVDFHPRLAEGEPDLLISGKNLNRPIVIEVATVFDEPQQEKEEQKFNVILQKLDSIEHYYSVIISNESDQIPDCVNYDKLISFIESQLSSLYSRAISDPQEFEYKEGGLKLRLTALPNLNRGPIILSYGGQARFIGIDQLRSAIEKKIQKYKSVKQRGLSFIVALNLANVPAGERGLLNVLFGDIVVRIRNDMKGELIDAKEGRNFKGLFTPKPGLGGKAQNTRLSAVLNIVSKWPERDVNEPISRVHYFRIIHNPWASNPIDTGVFKGFPQFKVVSQDDTEINLGWIDDVS
jgi:hypothetical protein